ncbi:MAG: hypothetical protein SGI96_00295 [Bacteroidota bacterium]|nr:hypothetical protein [Bacteroidota bacterium]
MRENEFEKRVQQKMGDFNLRPSEEVWTAVERRIRKEKKRRVIAWWPLFFLIAGGGIAAGILLTKKKGKEEIITANKKTETPIQSSLEKTSVPEPVNNSINTANPDTATNKNTAIIVKRSSDEIKIIPVKSATSVKPDRQLKEKQTNVIQKQQNNTEVNNKDIVTADNKNNKKNENPLVTNTVPSTKNEPLIPARDSAKVSNIAVVTKQDIPQKNQKQEHVPQPPDSVSKKETTKTTNKKTKKWDWGIHFSAGRSSIGQGLSFAGQRLYFDALALQSSSPPGLFSNSSSPVPPSFSLATGVYFKKAISKKLDLNAGLGYSYLSTKINAGSRVDSTRQINNYYSQGLTVNNFYRSDGNSSHINGYHFISLSADLSWRIIAGKKINIYWENGFSYNAMLGSSMLHYDRNLQGYYKDNSLLAKNQLAFSTGFSIPVSKRLGVSPFVSYNLTPVLKNSDTLHFTNYGIRIRFLINKK